MKKSKIIRINVPRSIAKAFKERIKKGTVGGVIIKDESYKNDNTIFELEADHEVNLDDMNIGFALAENKFAAAAISQAKEAEKLKQKASGTVEPICLEFSSEIRHEFLQLYGNKFKVTKQVASSDGKTTKFYFDVSEIVGRNELTKRIYDIIIAANSCSMNNRTKMERQYLADAMQSLERANGFEQTHVEFVRMTGQQLIDGGHCTAFDSDIKPAKFWQMFLNILLGKRSPKYDYIYMNMVVQPDKEYVLRFAKPRKLEASKPINHIDNINLMYEWGNQLYSGYGLKMVEKYWQEIAAKHNAAIDANK